MADFTDETPSGEEKIECVDLSSPVVVTYCGVCTMPIEYCEYSSSYEKCKEWIQSNEGDDVLAKTLADATLDDEKVGEDGEKKKKKKGAAPKTKKTLDINDCKIVIARIQRQKRKYVTAIAGLESVPDLKIKDAAKVFGKKFSSGSSVSDTASGGKEVVIQGDVMFQLPELLTGKNFKIPGKCIYFLEDGTLTPIE
jgi:density-regulated protein DRP1